MGFHQQTYQIPRIDTFVKSEDDRTRNTNYTKKLKAPIRIPSPEPTPEVKAKDFTGKCNPAALLPTGKWDKIYSAPEEKSEGVAGVNSISDVPTIASWI